MIVSIKGYSAVEQVLNDTNLKETVCGVSTMNCHLIVIVFIHT